MNKMHLIICETLGNWAAELWRRLPPGTPLVETRSLDEMWQRLATAPCATVALELTIRAAEQTIAAVDKMNRQFPHAAAIVLAEPRLAAWEQIVREAGAVHFIASRRKIDQIVELLRRRSSFAREELISTNAENISLEDRILASLLWGN